LLLFSIFTLIAITYSIIGNNLLHFSCQILIENQLKQIWMHVYIAFDAQVRFHSFRKCSKRDHFSKGGPSSKGRIRSTKHVIRLLVHFPFKCDFSFYRKILEPILLKVCICCSEQLSTYTVSHFRSLEKNKAMSRLVVNWVFHSNGCWLCDKTNKKEKRETRTRNSKNRIENGKETR